ncbi:hypothetical protein LAUMK4_05718 [Mycobacterium persicum]|uniref:Transposase IS200-like domain-containing protein n=1 Tax=Mycobacterium persicum TaxID=1487726 RepID=A0ABY6RSY4_9MYCO|nr:hypothetical protein LAUMK4_05718 [Mycobacterium persicum]
MSLLHAHLVFVTNYRRRLFTDQMLTFCEHTMLTVCTELDAELVEFNGEAEAAPGDKRDGLTKGLKPEACAQQVPVTTTYLSGFDC